MTSLAAAAAAVCSSFRPYKPVYNTRLTKDYFLPDRKYIAHKTMLLFILFNILLCMIYFFYHLYLMIYICLQQIRTVYILE